ncbi:hypothetical protein HED22_07260 [Thalassospira sp. HF15]|uniref:hypothetical protein n=1 Tax=Thalassospira sp. HF15 TaxID=2722755 RepID=UPI0014311EA5|nr:hypothetical protein [Thalassospira sp. HF15]NIY75436.1 hypothetical protein [Thalassospira sp. HF15]
MLSLLSKKMRSGLKMALLPIQKHRLLKEKTEFEKTTKRFFDELNSEADVLPLASRILVDGTWDNPNYWLRRSLMDLALGTADCPKEGIIGKYSRSSVKISFEANEIPIKFDTEGIRKSLPDLTPLAAELIRNSKSGSDILSWDLPGGVPGTLLYDSLLKWMRVPTITLDLPNIVSFVKRGLEDIETSRYIIQETKADLLLTSHMIGVFYGSLVWFALQRNIETVCLYGDFGSARFVRIKDPSQLTDGVCIPTPEEVRSRPDPIRLELAKCGREHLANRLKGQTNDIGGKFSFQANNRNISREEILEAFNWSPEKPIVAVYAQNWFDFPRYLGLDSFLDFRDWIEVTLNQARQNKNVNWLFKAHPIDRLYGIDPKDALSTIVGEQPSDHIAMAGQDWNGRSLMEAIDAAISCTGSIGFEFAAQGKPVLLAEKGWYGHLKFGVIAKDRDDYCQLLASEWWSLFEEEAMTRRAQEFIGWYFCLPAWQKGCIYCDDSMGQKIFETVSSFLQNNEATIQKEAEFLRSWYVSDHTRYHVYKTLTATEFQLGNIQL